MFYKVFSFVLKVIDLSTKHENTSNLMMSHTRYSRYVADGTGIWRVRQGVRKSKVTWK